MSKVKLYIAISLDGKIAKPDGDVSWLDEVPHAEGEDYGYAFFYDSIGITLMGNKTYREVLDFGIEFPYKEKTNYVFTRDTSLKKDENVTFVSEDIPSFMRQLKEEGEDIWLVGGGEINRLLLDLNLVDELLVFVMPVIIGEGLPFVPALEKDIALKLNYTKHWDSGVVELNYKIIK